MSFERSYSVESHERIKQILIFGDKSLLLMWWVTFITLINGELILKAQTCNVTISSLLQVIGCGYVRINLLCM